MEFFPHINVVVAKSTQDPFDQGTQGFYDVNT